MARIGLSEVTADQLRRAHAVHPIAAVQSEYSLWTRDVETGVLPALRELGGTFVAFSPVGRGMLASAAGPAEGYGEGDLRRSIPRFQGENYAHNRALVEGLERLAAGLEVTPAQLSLAWLLHQGEDIVPIPGTSRRLHLEENAAAEAIALDAEDLAALSDLFAPGRRGGPPPSGHRGRHRPPRTRRIGVAAGPLQPECRPPLVQPERAPHPRGAHDDDPGGAGRDQRGDRDDDGQHPGRGRVADEGAEDAAGERDQRARDRGRERGVPQQAPLEGSPAGHAPTVRILARWGQRTRRARGRLPRRRFDDGDGRRAERRATSRPSGRRWWAHRSASRSSPWQR